MQHNTWIVLCVVVYLTGLYPAYRAILYWKMDYNYGVCTKGMHRESAFIAVTWPTILFVACFLAALLMVASPLYLLEQRPVFKRINAWFNDESPCDK